MSWWWHKGPVTSPASSNPVLSNFPIWVMVTQMWDAVRSLSWWENQQPSWERLLLHQQTFLLSPLLSRWPPLVIWIVIWLFLISQTRQWRNQFCITSTRSHDFRSKRHFGPEKSYQDSQDKLCRFLRCYYVIMAVIHVIGDRTLIGWTITIINSPVCQLSYLLFMLFMLWE